MKHYKANRTTHNEPIECDVESSRTNVFFARSFASTKYRIFSQERAHAFVARMHETCRWILSFLPH